jgi:hypothetical protein
VKSIKPYDRAGVLSRLPIDLRTQILNHLYLPTIEVRATLLSCRSLEITVPASAPLILSNMLDM